MNTYYVWHDHLLEELFSMEKSELDTLYPELKAQLQLEKIIFYEIEADNMEHSYVQYRKLINDQSLSVFSSATGKPSLH